MLTLSNENIYKKNRNTFGAFYDDFSQIFYFRPGI